MWFYVVNYKLRRSESYVWVPHKGGIFPLLNRRRQNHHCWGCLVWDQNPCGAFWAVPEAHGMTPSRSWERDRGTGGWVWCQVTAKKCNPCFPHPSSKPESSQNPAPCAIFGPFPAPLVGLRDFLRSQSSSCRSKVLFVVLLKGNSHIFLTAQSLWKAFFFTPSFLGIKSKASSSSALPKKDVPKVRHSLPAFTVLWSPHLRPISSIFPPPHSWSVGKWDFLSTPRHLGSIYKLIQIPSWSFAHGSPLAKDKERPNVSPAWCQNKVAQMRQQQKPHQEMTQQLSATFSIWSHNSLISTDSAGCQENVPWISFHLRGAGSAFANPKGARLFSMSRPFPGSPGPLGSARKCKGEVSAWEIKGSQGKMTLLDIPAQWEGCVCKHLNQPF